MPWKSLFLRLRSCDCWMYFLESQGSLAWGNLSFSECDFKQTCVCNLMFKLIICKSIPLMYCAMSEKHDTFGWILYISENSRKSYVVDLTNDVFCNFPPEALMNTFSSYDAAYWLERISYNFLIWFQLLFLCCFFE